MISASPNLALIAVGQPQTPTPIANELAYIEANALNAGSTNGDSMAGPLSVPSLKVGGVKFSVAQLMYYGTDVGTVNALAVDNSTFPEPFAGMILAVKVLNTNTGSATLSVNGGSPYTIYQNDEALTGKELIVDNWTLFGFDGSFWNVIGMAPGGNPNVDQQMYSFPPGTRMLFQQATVPPGWTQDTTVQNDSLLRMVNGTGGGVYAGTHGVSTVLWGNGSTDQTAISVSELPAHSHPYSYNHQHDLPIGSESGSNSQTMANANEGIVPFGQGQTLTLAGLGATNTTTFTSQTYRSSTITAPYSNDNSTANTGSNAGHSHTLSQMNINSIDIIVGVKN